MGRSKVVVPKLVRVVNSVHPHKKYTAVFDTGKRVNFGGKGCMDYRLYWKQYGKTVAQAKRRAYIARHRVREDWTNPLSPGALSRILLWEFKTLQEGVQKYNAFVASHKKSY